MSTTLHQPTVTARKPDARWRRISRRMLRVTERGFALFGLMVAVYLLFFNLSVVVSPSMKPTLQGTNIRDGDYVLTERVTWRLRELRRWEVITFLNDEGIRVMKRVAGLPGESVRWSEGEFSVDGRPVELPASLDKKYLRAGNLADGNPVSCGDGYYVLGDDSRDSDDSRYNPPVSADRVLGHAWLVVWPKARIGRVK